MNIARGITQYDYACKRYEDGTWQENTLPNIKRTSDINFGVIGAGRIGGSILRKAKAIGFNCYFYDPYKDSGYEKMLGVNRTENQDELLKIADIISINKFDKKGSLDALKDVKKQYQRNNNLFNKSLDTMPVFGTIASQFNDPGTNSLYKAIINQLCERKLGDFSSNFKITDRMSEKIFVIPPHRVRYLSEITENNRAYDKWADNQKEIAQKLYVLKKTLDILENSSENVKNQIKKEYEALMSNLDPKNKILIDTWKEFKEKYSKKLVKERSG